MIVILSSVNRYNYLDKLYYKLGSWTNNRLILLQKLQNTITCNITYLKEVFC